MTMEVFIRLIFGLILIPIGEKILQKSEKTTNGSIRNILFIIGMIVVLTGTICCFTVWLTLQGK